MNLDFLPPPPLTKINHPAISPSRIKLYMLRLDLMHPLFGGNKWFKLKYNLQEAENTGHNRILTFGGPWSNHLAALAQTHGILHNMEMIGVIRGEKPTTFSPTLKGCEEKGMILEFISRSQYREKNLPLPLNFLKKKFGDCYLIPEGGANFLGEKGCSEIPHFINMPYDYICTPIGTGTTFSAISSKVDEKIVSVGFTVVKNDLSLMKLFEPQPFSKKSIKVINNYHFGGFARVTDDLRTFKSDFESHTGITLDYIYTSKMMYGIFDLIAKGFFRENTTIVALHTGGLQGNIGFES